MKTDCIPFQDSFCPIQLDLLKEVGNIGAGNAAASLSSLLNIPIAMSVPSIQIAGFDEVMESAGGAAEEMTIISLRIEGEAPGSMFFALAPNRAELFLTLLLGDLSNTLDLRQSALEEIGNIIAGSYLSSLADFTRLELFPSVPVVINDMVGAVLSTGLIELSKHSDQALVIETVLIVDQAEQVHGVFLLFPDPLFYDALFRSEGVTSEG
ncbi:chemotaxis protein CheC [Halobacillus sp. A5]|uniref:chemotaxis protein CheC n=1 Tax=Halobacillus sp. A5 TaxID=2880263 RepID=UPI0020A62949|nr:chemotaxis protein CheC [Halobacillus sp. A5]MCP3026099.1 chemotaxis protein CheC [Halobacillus sp. A5]